MPMIGSSNAGPTPPAEEQTPENQVAASDTAAGEAPDTTEAPRAAESMSPRKKAGILAGVGAVAVVVFMNFPRSEPEPEPVVVDTVKPTLKVGEVDIYEDAYIEDYARQTDEEIEQTLRALEGGVTPPSAGTAPAWAGKLAPSLNAVPSTHRVQIAGGPIVYSNEAKADARSEDLDPVTAADSTEGEEGIGSHVSGGLKNSLKKVTGGGVVSGIVIDGVSSAAKSQVNRITGQ
ncbi:hypothetical protein [Citreimonas salinaria]|uniref:Uncharacterized protein n=1 Tax=Citreimonas salinaria TaxID=321339 RepID=A0A1H3NIU3_9RHOB|nr:hypothetical protein [Citreimonas salinaria]SDY88355.1 hypothetical protein SAMN05444340_12428 [Citreimonas salinaria]